MLSLALLRHAKSSWDDPSLDDFERPLNARGHDAAPLMGQTLAKLDFHPDIVLCSPSRRTRETWLHVSQAMRPSTPAVVFDEQLYLASALDLLLMVRSLDAGSPRVLVIGHNPGLHGFALTIAGAGSEGDRSRLEDKFPTAGFALFAVDAQAWADVGPGNGRLVTFITPKQRA